MDHAFFTTATAETNGYSEPATLVSICHAILLQLVYNLTEIPFCEHHAACRLCALLAALYVSASLSRVKTQALPFLDPSESFSPWFVSHPILTIQTHPFSLVMRMLFLTEMVITAHN